LSAHEFDRAITQAPLIW